MVDALFFLERVFESNMVRQWESMPRGAVREVDREAQDPDQGWSGI